MDQNPPTVSVIIPTYNSSGTLRLSLESALRQDFSDLEVWVVGDGCTDDSAAVVESFGDSRAHWINLPVNSGTPSKPRDEALRHATGRLIAYLGHDDLWFPWHLSGLVDCIDKTLADLVYSICVCVEPSGASAVLTMPDRPWDQRQGISPSNWLHRRHLYDQIGPWIAAVKLGDDRDFLARAHAADARLEFREDVSVLKFPAAAWKMYARISDLPQTAYMEALRRDPAQLRLDLLLDLARAMSRQPVAMTQGIVPLPGPLRTLLEWSLDRYGRRRWPLNDFLYGRWRHAAGLTRDKVH
jgi:glycosyltransferase involved in cell wall biosynthesis